MIIWTTSINRKKLEV